MVITNLEVQKKNKNRVNLYLDDKFFCGLEVTTVLKNNLRINGEMTKEELEQIQFDSEKQVALNKVVALISKNMKTKKQIKDYLKTKGYTPKIVDFVIEKLSEYGYIDDNDYANRYMKQNSRNKGVRKIKQELVLKGVPSKIIDQTLENMPDQKEEIETLVNKYMKNKEKNQKNMKKLYDYLTRRGFTYEQIQPFLKEDF